GRLQVVAVVATRRGPRDEPEREEQDRREHRDDERLLATLALPARHALPLGEAWERDTSCHGNVNSTAAWAGPTRQAERGSMAASLPAVDGEGVARGAVPREERGASGGPRAQALAERGVVEVTEQGIAERAVSVRIGEDPRIADDLLDGAGAEADHRRARGERLERRQAEPLEQRGVEQA